MVGTSHHPMASKGRMDDTMIAHVARGEQIVPKPVLDANPDLALHIAHAILSAGADPNRYRVGGNMSHNPKTGKPEFGFFSHGFGRILAAAAPIVVGAFNPALGAAVGAGIGAASGGGVLGTATGAASGYFGGSALGGAASGFSGLPVAGTVGPTAGGISGALSGVGAGISGAADSLGSLLGMSGSTIGTAAKIASAANLFGSTQNQNALNAQKIGNPDVVGATPGAGTPFSPTRPAEVAAPTSLNPMASYSPEQVRSALATQGINSGLGSDQTGYYKNLLQRSLIGDNNQVTKDPNFLMPIESQYFSRKGLNTSDPTEFLRGLQNFS